MENQQCVTSQLKTGELHLFSTNAKSSVTSHPRTEARDRFDVEAEELKLIRRQVAALHEERSGVISEMENDFNEPTEVTYLSYSAQPRRE